MEITYTATEDDIVAMNMYFYRQSGAGRRLRLRIGVVFALFVLAVVCTVIPSDGHTVSLLPLLIWLAWSAVYLAIASALTRTLTQAGVRGYVRRLGTRGVTGPVRLTLGEESLVEVNGSIRTECRWADVLGVEADGGRTYIRVSSLAGAILPRHGFGTDAEYQRAVDYARSRVASAAAGRVGDGSGPMASIS